MHRVADSRSDEGLKTSTWGGETEVVCYPTELELVVSSRISSNAKSAEAKKPVAKPVPAKKASSKVGSPVKTGVSKRSGVGPKVGRLKSLATQGAGSSGKIGRESQRKTKTSSFGVSRREGHDASDFYARFPELKQDESGLPSPPSDINQIYVGDARDMSNIADNSVALVVTSPPYYAGKAYELERGSGGIPASYVEYLQMLHDVFTECWRVLEPGGRIAINIANLGRRPYRSLSADVTRILQDDIGYLLRGEILWIKAEGASGSCAWGSFQSAANPVLRDVTERVVLASKLRLDRALTRKQRKELGLPSEDTISKEDFMESTLDTWKVRPESAKRVGHPAPFPIELPRRLIELLSYRNDLVLDPFMGAGSTALAAQRTGRNYVGYEMDRSYVDLSLARLAGELAL